MGKYSYEPSSKKLLIAANGNYHRKDTCVNREETYGSPVPKRYMCITAFASMAQDTAQKRSREDYKSQYTRNSTVQ